MNRELEVTFAPAEFELLPARDLSETACVVFDVLRATSSMITALASGADAIRPVTEITEALEVHLENSKTILAGERDGLRIAKDLTGGIDFHLGNSPREFVPASVKGRTVVMTTTNGTRALRASAGAHTVLVSSFLNLTATAECIRQSQFPRLLIVCGGTFEQMAYEDVLAAGALCDLIWRDYVGGRLADSALMARSLYQAAASDLLNHLARSRNGQRLLRKPELADDLAYCARRDITDVIAVMGKDGLVRRLQGR